MGRGDKRTRRGKIFKGSYGKTRPQRTARSTKPSATGAATAAKKTPAVKKSK